MGRLIFRWLAVAAVMVGVMLTPASSQAATLAPTPYMGWNPYYGVGGVFDESTIESVAQSLSANGLEGAGYRIVWLDFGWASGARDSNGQLIVNPSQWPDGMSGLTAWLHQRGFEAGIYTDAGRSGCNGQGVGSYGHYQQDANTFAAWGFDAVKVDFCGAGQEGFAPQPLYTEFAQALSNNSSHRPMIINVDNFWTPKKIDGTNPSQANSSWGDYVWAPQIAQSWRTDTDIGFTEDIQFQWVLRNLDQDATHPEAAGPGHWNDPDYLGPGLGNPTPSMTDTQAQSQFSMWAMLAAPLMLGSDPRKLTSSEISMLENANVIAVDQDALGAQATLVSQSGSGQVWAKPLADGDVAVALLNRGTSSMSISTTAAAVGLPQASSYTLQDLWANTTTTTSGPITATVPAQSVTLYRVAPSAPANNTAMLRVSVAGADSGTITANTGPISCPGTCSARYPTNSPVTLTATPTGGATFAGWSGGGCSGTGPCTLTMSSDTSVTAIFAFPLPRLTVSVAGSGSVTDASGLISCPGYCSGSYWDGTAVTLTATPSPGYVFKGWSGGDCSGTGTCTVPLLGDMGVTAAFAPARTLTVSVIGAGRGTVTAPGIACPGTCSAKYPEGSTVTLVATPAAGSQFGAWQGGTCPEFASSCTVTLTANAALTVAFDVARSGNAYVVNAGDATVTPVDLTNDTVTHAITGFDAPRQIAIAPDGGTAYVVNTGDNTVSPINLATDATEPRITGFQRPGPIVISPNGKTAYVLEDNRRLVPVNLATNQAQPAITFTTRSGIGDYAASLAISRNGRTVYIGSFTRGAKATRGTVAKFDLATQRVTVMAHGLADPAALAITPNGRTAYVADPVRGAVTPIDVYTHKSINAAKLGRAGALPKANAITITPDGRTVYVAAAQGVGVIDTATNAEKDLDLPGIYSPRGVAMTADGGTVYVINGNGAVVPVDVATNTERAKLTGFSSPSAIAIAAPPIANYSARLARRPKRTRVGLSDVITCLSATTSCTTIQTLTTTEMVSPGSAVAVTAHAQPHRERISLVVGLRKVRIRPLGTVAIVIKLNPLGRLLLGRFGSLPVILSVAIRRGSHTDTVTTRRLILAPQS